VRSPQRRLPERESRLFFTLDVFGHARVSLLDGGIQAWQRRSCR
jgi:3-mercaptopyruvate sulfurtransferase SseA